MHPILEILLLVVLVVLALWIVEKWMMPPTADPMIRWVIRFVVGAFALLWVLDVAGVVNVLGCHGDRGSLIDGR